MNFETLEKFKSVCYSQVATEKFDNSLTSKLQNNVIQSNMRWGTTWQTRIRLRGNLVSLAVILWDVAQDEGALRDIQENSREGD